MRGTVPDAMSRKYNLRSAWLSPDDISSAPNFYAQAHGEKTGLKLDIVELLISKISDEKS